MYFYLNSEKVLTLKQLSELLDLSEQQIIDFSKENNINIIETLEKNIKNKHDIKLITCNHIKLIKKDDVKKIIKYFDKKLYELLFDNSINSKEKNKIENEYLKKDASYGIDEIMLINYNDNHYIILSDLAFLAGVNKQSMINHVNRKMKNLTKIKIDDLNKLDNDSLRYLRNKKIKFGNKAGIYILNLEEAEEIASYMNIVENKNLSNDLKILFKIKKIKKKEYTKSENFESYTKLSLLDRIKLALKILKG